MTRQFKSALLSGLWWPGVFRVVGLGVLAFVATGTWAPSEIPPWAVLVTVVVSVSVAELLFWGAQHLAVFRRAIVSRPSEIIILATALALVFASQIAKWATGLSVIGLWGVGLIALEVCLLTLIGLRRNRPVMFGLRVATGISIVSLALGAIVGTLAASSHDRTWASIVPVMVGSAALGLGAGLGGGTAVAIASRMGVTRAPTLGAIAALGVIPGTVAILGPAIDFMPSLLVLVVVLFAVAGFVSALVAGRPRGGPLPQ